MSIVKLIEEILPASDSTEITHVLQSITKYVNGYGCILWKLFPDKKSPTHRNDKSAYFFTLAHWFPELDIYGLHNLPLNNSVTGYAVTQNKAQWVGHYKKDKRVNLNPRFWTNLDVVSFCSVPITFRDTTRGALNIYYQKELDAENNRSFKLAQKIAVLVPGLYQSTMDRASFELLRDIDTIFQEIKSSQVPLQNRVKASMEQICERVGETFRSVETTILLEPPHSAEKFFEIVATTWLEKIQKKRYTASDDDGLTGWSLNHKLPVRIFDLAHFERDKLVICQNYPGINWNDPFDLAETTCRIFKLNKKEDLPPLSFMVAPVMSGGHVAGAIRCAVAKRGPHFYSQQDLELLRLVASRVGQEWKSWADQQRTNEEIDTWKKLNNSVRELNKYILACVDQQALNNEDVFNTVFRELSRVAPNADNVSIRLIDEHNKELYFAYWHGEAWHTRESKKILAKRYPVTGHALGVAVFNSGELEIIPDTTSSEQDIAVLPETKRMIIAPITAGKKRIGILDVRFSDEDLFPDNTRESFVLLGQQLGLYYQISRIINEQRNTFENLAHQLKTPVLNIFIRIKKALSQPLGNEMILHQDLRTIRSLTNKLRTITGGIGLFAEIARGQKIKPNKSTISLAFLQRVVRESCEDNTVSIDPNRNIGFTIDRQSFQDVFRRLVLKCDQELLIQVIDNLLDNASKYSFADTTIYVGCGSSSKNNFYLAVRNKGIPIKKGEIGELPKRGWRSKTARRVTSSGSGIGLWIVDLIMEAHDGSLHIFPTTKDGWTEMRLIFPAQKRISLS